MPEEPQRRMSKIPRVSYLGPEATFTHEAARRYFGERAEFVPEGSIAAVFEATESSQSNWGVVPIENVLEGTVNLTLDRLMDSPLVIAGEIHLPIDIHLITRAERLENVTCVLSHPHAVAQCRSWLQENLPGVSVEEVASTALAAQRAAQDERLAALGSRMAAQYYGLRVLVAKIDTESINVTRFFVLGKEAVPRADPSKTSLLFVLKNQAGALYHALAPIAERELNMTKIESRPSRQKAWDYVFFMEIEGHTDDEKIATGIASLRARVEYLRVLGSYPVGEHIAP